MIISASYRTDIPAFYGAWFLARLRAGACRVVNPYGGQLHEIPLTPAEVDGFVFWTRNAAPFLGALEETAARGFPFVVQYTITGYPRPLEPSVVPAERAVAVVRDLAVRYGPRVVVWRYDPVFVTSLTPPEWHLERFASLARALAGVTDEVVLSFTQIYAKTRANSATAARRHGFAWQDPEPDAKAALLGQLAAIARENGLVPTLCSQPELLRDGLAPARCIDAERLADIGGQPFRVRNKGNRPGCLCAESRDIGAYDTCPHGCIYCYAVRKPARAKTRYQAHDPEAEALGEALGQA
ncbi:MAG: DUF1848 domain-containing protein [Rhodospirillales bacterium]|nr:DUF1848 domain-containing protein [Rhodospirillales bacterium]